MAGGLAVGPVRCTGYDNDNYKNSPEECGRLTTMGRQLLDKASHAPVASVAIYKRPSEMGTLNIAAGMADFASLWSDSSEDTDRPATSGAPLASAIPYGSIFGGLRPESLEPDKCK